MSLVAIVLMPLVVIGVQIAAGASGAVANASYKLVFLLGPVIYCRMHGISLAREVFRWQNWRNGWPLSLALGVLGAAIFLGAYAAFGAKLVDESVIVAKIHQQFSVSAATVLTIAPITILANSLLEEFFYRGFAYGQLVKRNKLLGIWLPAGVFTAQHLLFIYHWVTPLPLTLAIVGLTVFALVLQAMYSKADSIVSPWLIHIFGDVAMMAIAVRLLFVD